jgi:hypothetical protein
MAKSYAEKIGAISAVTENSSFPNYPNLHWCADGEGHRFFRLDFDLPALFSLSEPVSRFKAYRQYVIPISEEKKFYADFAMIPAYNSNMNRLTCIDLYGDQAATFFAAGSRPLQGADKVCWRFDPSSSSQAQFSSMNFILKWGAVEAQVPEAVSSAVSMYFQFAFWVLPRPGFASNAHLIHSRDNISRIMKVAKSLYIVRKIGEVHPERIAPYYTTLVQKVDMEVITNSGDVRPFSAYLAKDVVESLNSHNQGNKGLLINGVVYEFKDRVQRPGSSFGMLSVVEDFLPTDYDLFRTLVSLTASDMFQSNGATLGLIGRVEDLERCVGEKYGQYMRNVEIEGTLLSRLEHPIDYQVDSLFPLLIRTGAQVIFVHPLVISALLKLRLASVLEKHETPVIAAFVSLTQRMKTEKPSRLRFTAEAELFKGLGIDFAELLPVAYSVFCGIQISRVLADYT